ncbi:MAG: type VI secretion system baseplate subunit TssK, partial [Planctomycetes bacterium]|nr:type VI secretion system baseplate subunit TssK [Planctomycetota bacterium]
MMLAPQHFQQWERWLEGELRGRGKAGAAHGWGFTGLTFDPGALAGGQLTVTHCAGILPDGAMFSCPDRDPLPATLAAADAIDDKVGSILVHLCAPKVVQGMPAYGDTATSEQPIPMLRRRLRVVDVARPETDREIATAQLNLSLRFEGDDLSAFRTMPIARLQRSAGGGVELAPNFAAPALALHACPLAQSILRQTSGMVAQKWTELSGKRRGAGSGMADAAGLLLLHTAGEHLPALRHLIEHGGASPEAAYLQLARLAAQLCTFHAAMTPAEIPAYRHEDAGPTFRELGDMLQELLGDAAPSMCDTIPLEREGESLYWARIPSPDMFSSGSLFLSVRADASEEDIQARLTTLSKISAQDRVQDLLMRAIPGLPIRYVAQPPAAIPTQAGRVYFRLEPDGDHWEAMRASLTVALHVSPGLAKIDLELLA